MAAPISLELNQQNGQAGLKRRLNEAPVNHADALLAAYDVLQRLHDRGILDTLRGALASSDFILETAVETAKTPESIRTVRNLILLSKLLGSIEPELLNRIAGAIPEGLGKILSDKTEAPSLLSLLRKFNSPDCRRGMALTAGLLESLGKGLEDSGLGTQDSGL
jgi:uncharacterized protein YjgD (DUF1641 family)